VLDWIGGLEEKELTIGIMVLYQLWLARNDAREETRIIDPRQIAQRSIYLVEEWRASREQLKPVAPRAVEHWLPPDGGWHKVNADGAYSAESHTGGCGVVLRNHHGEFIAGASHFLTSVSDPERAEIIACKRAVELARNVGVTKVCLESDYLGAVSKIRNKDRDRSIHGPLIEEVKELLRGFSDHLVKHVRRSCNSVAHILAREGCLNKACNSWLVVPSRPIVDLLASEGAV
jgi:ribonuclease HI